MAKAATLEDMNPHFFIVGCTRSGTTLTQRIMDAHPDVAVANESHWIIRPFRKQPRLPIDVAPTPDLLSLVTSQRKFRNIKVSPVEVQRLLDEEEPRTYRDLVSRMFDLHAEKKGKTIAGDKTPSFVRSLALLHALWPYTKFVHLIRDGRDVALSTLDWKKSETFIGPRFRGWREDPLMITALRWEWSVRLGRETGRLLGPGLYHEVRYEDLVNDTDRTLKEVCDFVGVEVDDAMLRFHEGKTRSDPTLSSKRAWLPVTPGLRDWTTQMPVHDVERFEAVAGDLLGELGYRRGHVKPSPTIQARAAHFRESFSADVIDWGYPLPEVW
jgi:hypothetical protein